MRIALLISFLLLFVADNCATHAADLPISRGDGNFDRFSGARAGMLVGYDFESGVTIRPYWLRPWRDRHYFPFGVGHKRSTTGTEPSPAQHERCPGSLVMNRAQTVLCTAVLLASPSLAPSHAIAQSTAAGPANNFSVEDLARRTIDRNAVEAVIWGIDAGIR